MGCLTRLPRSASGSEGFTLLEVVLALSIMSVVLVLVMAALQTGFLSWEKGERSAQRAAAMRYAALRMTREIGAMYLYEQKGGPGARDGHVLFSAGPRALGFATLDSGAGALGAPEGARFVSYAMGPEGLEVSEQILPAANPSGLSAGAARLVLAPGVREARFEYLGQGGWADGWRVEEARRLPFAVRATLDFGGPAPLVLVVPVASSRGAGGAQ